MNPKQVAEVDENGHEDAKRQCMSFEDLAAVPVPQNAKVEEVEVDIEQLSLESWATYFARRKYCARWFGVWCERTNFKAKISGDAFVGRVRRGHGFESVVQQEPAVLINAGDELSWLESRQHTQQTGHKSPAHQNVDRSFDGSLDGSLDRQQHDRLIEDIMSAALVGPHFLEQKLLTLHKSGDLDDG